MSEPMAPIWKRLGFWVTVAGYAASVVSATATAVVQQGVFGEGSVELKLTLVALTVAGFIATGVSNLRLMAQRSAEKANIERGQAP